MAAVNVQSWVNVNWLSNNPAQVTNQLIFLSLHLSHVYWEPPAGKKFPILDYCYLRTATTSRSPLSGFRTGSDIVYDKRTFETIYTVTANFSVLKVVPPRKFLSFTLVFKGSRKKTVRFPLTLKPLRVLIWTLWSESGSITSSVCNKYNKQPLASVKDVKNRQLWRYFAVVKAIRTLMRSIVW